MYRLALNIITSSCGIVRDKFLSHKSVRMIPYKRLLELLAIYLFDTSAEIVRDLEQPISPCLSESATLRRHALKLD